MLEPQIFEMGCFVKLNFWNISQIFSTYELQKKVCQLEQQGYVLVLGYYLPSSGSGPIGKAHPESTARPEIESAAWRGFLFFSLFHDSENTFDPAGQLLAPGGSSGI